MSTLKQVTAINGHILEVDTSEEACAKFGFPPWQNIITPFGKKGIVVGVAPLPESAGACAAKGDNVLWVLVDGFDGKVCFFPNPSFDLRVEQ